MVISVLMLLALSTVPFVFPFQGGGIQLKLRCRYYMSLPKGGLTMMTPQSDAAVFWTTIVSVLSDPGQSSNVADDFLYQVEDITATTFFASFSSRLIGTLLGNILAGIAFKIVIDKISELFNSRKPVEPVQAKIFIPSSESIGSKCVPVQFISSAMGIYSKFVYVY